MKLRKIPKKHMATFLNLLDHFMLGGWPIRYSESDSHVVKTYMPYIRMESGLLICGIANIPAEHQLVYYKDQAAHYQKLYSLACKHADAIIDGEV